MFFSQHGEDKWIAGNMPIAFCGVMVEVGVGRPAENSNSLYFEQLGWHVHLVEPNPELWPEIERCRKGRLYKCAAGRRSGEMEFALEKEPTLSGFLRSSPRRISVPVKRLDELFSADPIDVLSIDTEGTELDVWAGAGALRPPIVIVEYSTVGFPERPIPIIQRFINDGYRLVHTTVGNLIFYKSK